ncbi:cytochrome c [Phycisphaeraceae bacterium D3-23]
MKLSDIDLDLRFFPAPPMWLVAVVVIGGFLPMTVASAVWYKRNKMTEEPRYHIFQDMDASIAVKAQEASEVFADGRGARPYAPGTVAWGRHATQADPGMLRDDDLAYRGYTIDAETGEVVQVNTDAGPAPQYLAGFPEIVRVNTRFLERGQQQYNTFCMPCHGRDGLGEGAVSERATHLVEQKENPSGTVWTAPANLTDHKFTQDLYPNGQMFNTITHGANNMAAYGPQIDVADRWAIVAYVRAIQASDRVEGPPGVAHDHDGDGVPDH